MIQALLRGCFMRVIENFFLYNWINSIVVCCCCFHKNVTKLWRVKPFHIVYVFPIMLKHFFLHPLPLIALILIEVLSSIEPNGCDGGLLGSFHISMK